jgi:hypothetical protein
MEHYIKSQVTQHKAQGQMEQGGTKPQSQAFLCGFVSRCVVMNAIELSPWSLRPKNALPGTGGR